MAYKLVVNSKIYFLANSRRSAKSLPSAAFTAFRYSALAPPTLVRSEFAPHEKIGLPKIFSMIKSPIIRE